MTNDEAKRPGDVTWSSSGVGHYSGWTCGSCAKPKGAYLGRKLQRVRGVKTWVCKECAK